MSLIRVNNLTSYPLHSVAATRVLEQAAAAQWPANTLMQRTGLAVAKLASALAPHARTIWVACGPGNNGGDGLEAAMHLHLWAKSNGINTGKTIIVTWLGTESRSPPDALAALHRARAAGVIFADQPPAQCDLAIDAMLGIGAAQALTGTLLDWQHHMHSHAAAVLCVDVPSGLNADTGCEAEITNSRFDAKYAIKSIANYPIKTPAIGINGSIFCLSLLTLKPGLFTAQGKDAAGQVWFDDLGVAAVHLDPAPTACLLGNDRAGTAPRLHASHKGSYGDVAVVGGAMGMTGAALLAARAALHAGAGRVFVSLLAGDTAKEKEGRSLSVDPMQPELMFRALDKLNLRQQTVVCGCGGGDAVRAVLPQILSQCPRLVLDADALNAIAADTALQALLTARHSRNYATILTPHPLEAARLLGCSTAHIQANRLQAAQQLADRFACTVILKGAGSIIAAPDQVLHINHSGNAKLATAGTGDVLAGMVGAVLAGGSTAFESACMAAIVHGCIADDWTAGKNLTASEMVKLDRFNH